MALHLSSNHSKNSIDVLVENRIYDHVFSETKYFLLSCIENVNYEKWSKTRP